MCPLLRHSVLLHECRSAAGIPPRIRNVKMGRHGDESVVGRPRGAAVCGLESGCVNAFNAKLDELELVVEALATDANDRMQRHLHVR